MDLRQYITTFITAPLFQDGAIHLDLRCVLKVLCKTRLESRYFDKRIQPDLIHDWLPGAHGGITHSFFRGKTNFPFGYGLSYTNFTYKMVSGVQLHSNQAGAARRAASAMNNEAASIFSNTRTTTQLSTTPGTHVVEVCNIGDRASQVVVLAFVSSDVPNAPLQSLFAFDRIALEAGESKRLRFTASAHDLSTVDEKGERHLLPGNYSLKIGDVVAPAVEELELTGVPVVLPRFSATKVRV